MRISSTVAASALLAVASAADSTNYLGFNSGATKADRSAKFKADFKAEFDAASNLKGAPGDFNAVRLYTNIQAYSDSDPIEAFDAAVETKTKLLLGVWASGTDNIDKELSALKKGIEKHGSKLTDLVIGITIGSEDLYRISETGIKNKSGVGNSPKAIVGFIENFRSSFKSTALAKVPVGHADTWDAWGNSTNKAVIDNVDFIAVHEYPYYETGKGNSIDNAAKLFQTAYDNTLAAAGSKPVWVTETGWPYTGPDWDEAKSGTDNAKKYWQEVGCKKLFNKVPTFWYTLRDSNPDNEVKFAITDNLSTTPRFNLSCDGIKDDDKSSSSSSSASKTGSSSATKTGSSTASKTPGGDDDSTTLATATPTPSSGNSNGGSSGTTTGASAGTTSDPPSSAPGQKLFSAYTYAALAVVGAAFAMF
ncbi:unnamed protein product [Clonostachys rosea]|uniref:Uncharacterized protein n=1 Tax=Bionectria ochroleuca TaxID=29856 RepID=A0ABY6TT50_BIOOC|nr:unnamed protein product [Clonostachys rosea]